MIIFNLYAILVAIVILIFWLPIHFVASVIFPGYESNEQLGLIVFMVIATVVSGGTESAGVPGRLFFLPMWLVGILGTLFLVTQEFGWIGIGVTVASAIGLIGLLVYLLYASENKTWQQAPIELVECQRIQDSSTKDFWEHFQKALFLPVMKDYTPSICQHNLQCVELLRNLGVDWPIIDGIKQRFELNLNNHGDIKIDEKLTDELKEMISGQLETFEV